ncbi:MAG: hypothetical protein SGPRY_011353 [Prymnesium sp.]
MPQPVTRILLELRPDWSADRQVQSEVSSPCLVRLLVYAPADCEELCLRSIQAKREDFTLRLFGTIDLNRKAASRAGAELIYDLD